MFRWVSIHKKSLLPPVVLSLICLFLITINHVPGSWLSGWDTLHPEFNFGLNFSRLFWGVFRDNQGLGAVAAHSHMSDLPRVILLYISSLVIPASFLRYLYIALCLPIGVLGAYFFCLKIIFNRETSHARTFSFLGALFYLLNLGTLQQFYVPFEMFTTQYAFLPWLFLTATNYLNDHSRKNLFFFSLATLLSTPMAYAATLWYAYFLVFFFYLMFFVKRDFRKVLVLIAATLLINSFWLLPNLYFIGSGNADFVPEAKINKIFSEEAFSYNKSYGNIVDAVIFKNFLFDWPVYSGHNQFNLLLNNWNAHIKNPLVGPIGYILFTLVFVGLSSLIPKVFDSKTDPTTKRFSKALILPTLIALIFIINLNPPFNYLFGFFRDNFTLFREALRFPYDKFSIILMFCFSAYFAIGCRVLAKSIPKQHFEKQIVFWQTAVISLLLVIYMFPAFQGDLISKYMQIKIPQEYFEMFDWLNTQPNDARVANLPIQSFWGWIYYNWGFQGAQFISFGIKQPLLDRDYDRWNPNNEEYYREMSYAIYQQNSTLVYQVLQKFKVGFVLVDHSVIAPGYYQDKELLFTNQIDSLFQSQGSHLKLAKHFGDIDVYQVENQNTAAISSPKEFVSLKAGGGARYIDWVYQKYGDYINGQVSSNASSISEVNFPFLSINDNQDIANSLVKQSGNNIVFSTQNITNPSTLPLDDYYNDEANIPADLYAKIDQKNVYLKITFKSPVGKTPTDVTQLPSVDYSIPLDKTSSQTVINTNQNKIILLNNDLSTDFQYQGGLNLNKNSFNNLSVYEDSGTTTNTAVDGNIQLCSAALQNQLISAKPLKNGLQMNAENAEGCIHIPFKDIFKAGSPDTFAKLSFTNQSNSQELGHYCIFDDSLGRCVREQRSVANLSTINEYLPVDPDSVDKMELILYIDNPSSTLKDITYSDFNITYLKQSSFISIAPDDISKVIANQSSTVSPSTPLSLSLLNNSLTSNFSILENGHTADPCSTISPIKFYRNVNSDGKFIEYGSETGSSCDYFSFPNLPHNTGYILTLTDQNVSGLPLRICVANNYTKRCDLYLSLPPHSNFQKDILIIPPASDGGSGYDIHIDNYSIGTDLTVNRIQDLNIIPFPYNWITSMNFKTEGQNSTSQLTINSTKEILPDLYLANYSKFDGAKSLLQLDKSYDFGWWLIGNTKHITANGWANGWIIEGQSGTAVIIYWPQLLETLSLIAVVLFFGLLGIRRFR